MGCIMQERVKKGLQKVAIQGIRCVAYGIVGVQRGELVTPILEQHPTQQVVFDVNLEEWLAVQQKEEGSACREVLRAWADEWVV